MLWAQEMVKEVVRSADPLGGWGSLLLQGGCFGLICYIVIRLYPQESAKGQKERERRDQLFAELIDKMQDKFGERNKELATAAKEAATLAASANKEVVAAVHEQTGFLSEALRDSATEIKVAVAQACHARGGQS